MDLICPYCHGNSIVMVTGPDGRTVTVCTKCDKPVFLSAPKDEEKQEPKLS